MSLTYEQFRQRLEALPASARSVEDFLRLYFQANAIGSDVWDFIASELSTRSIQFDIDADPTLSEGGLAWDEAEHCPVYETGLGNTVQINKEIWEVGVNKTGGTALDGKVVYASGVQGNRLSYDYADARDPLKCSFVGVVTASTENNAEGPVTNWGYVNDVDTSAWPEETKLYIAADGTGTLTDTAPDAPNFRIWVATVTNSHATQGSLFVSPRLDFSNGVTLTDLHTSLFTSGDIASGDYSEFEADGTLKFNGNATVYDDALFELTTQQEKLHASSGSVGGIVGTSSGTFEDTLSRNGVYWQLDENNGDTNDFFVDPENPLVFEDIVQVPVLFWSGQYTGTSAHAANMSWRAYNHTTAGTITDVASWDTLAFTFVENTQYTDAIVSGFTSDHISGTGEVWVVPVHTSNGAAGHSLLLDEVYLSQDNTPLRTFYKGGFIDAFRNTGFDMAHGKVQFTHRYKTESDFMWHVHFVNFDSIADGETVSFTLTKTFAGVFRKFPTQDSITATFTNDATWRSSLTAAQAADILSGTTVLADSNLIAGYGSTIDGTGLGISSIGIFEIVRAVGTHASNVGVLYSDFHIEIDTAGSRQEFIK